MLGGIIGDLAASTYLREPQVFYKQLFDERATLSEYGLSILATVSFLRTSHIAYTDKEQCKAFVLHYFVSADMAQLSENATLWKYNPNMRLSPVAQGMLLNRLATNALISDDPEKTDIGLFFDDNMDKPEGYARMFVRKLIARLHSGATKDEVYEELGDVFKGIRHDWQWKENQSVLDLLMRAWDCFYTSFDFGSAIHNAVRYPNSNTRQLASLTGLIAEAMYGCRSYFVKEKFNPEHDEVDLYLPKSIGECYREDLEYGRKQMVWNNVFWPKNNSRTNIEWHSYTPIKSRYHGLEVSKEIQRRILRSFEPGWESRYSFYLDNGWIYLCRSFHLIGRFQMISSSCGFKLCHIQQSNQGHPFDDSFECAFDVVNNHWASLGQIRFRYLKSYYYEFEEECPKEYRGTIKEKFWKGEKDFYETEMGNLGQWIKEGKQYIYQLANPSIIEKAKQLGQESFGVAYYIDQSFKRKYPSDRTDWIMEY